MNVKMLFIYGQVICIWIDSLNTISNILNTKIIGPIFQL